MSVEEIKNLPDVSEGLENVIKNAANSCNNIIDLVNMIKSKRYTQTRIQRILVYALLGIDKKMMENSRKIVPYARILGYSDRGKYLISEIMSQNPKLNLVTSVKDFLNTSKNKMLKEMLQTDIYSTNIYTLGYEKDSWSNLDYTNKIVTLQDLKEKK
ncbi:MAG: nucleotidyltransferase family protein [Intestinibacter sp.]